MDFNTWVNYINGKNKKGEPVKTTPYKNNSFAKDQMLLLHDKDIFVMYVINRDGVKEILKATDINRIYKYLLNNYCAKDNRVTYNEKVNVYYDDLAVKRAMEAGILLTDGTRLKGKQNDNGHIINQTTMYHCINLRYVHYYFGIDIGQRSPSDKDDKTFKDNVRSVIKAISERNPAEYYTIGFTYGLKKKFVTPTTYTDFVITKNEKDDYNKDGVKATSTDYNLMKDMAINSNLGALIGCTRNKELYNIYSYDITSAYIYHLYSSKFPSANYKYVTYDEFLQADKDKYAFYIKLRISASIKPEYEEKQIFPMPKGSIPFVMEDKCKITKGGKVILCYDMTLGVWNNDIKYIKEFYNIDAFDVLQVWQFELKPLPDELKREMLNLYRLKQRKKENGENYKTEKIILNRGGYGLWVTKKDDTNPYTQLTSRIQSDWAVPFQVGSYIVALQRELLLKQMRIIGMDHVVAFHTDSIKTNKNFDEYFNSYNANIDICDDLGHFKREWKADKIFFYNSVRYKAISDEGKLIIKHGGINEKDMTEVFHMDYDDITADTEIEIDSPNSAWINPDTGVRTCDRIITTMSKTEDYMVGSELLAIN